MREQFLRELNYELSILNKSERKKCLNNYEEIILDKMENGVTEDNAVVELGNVKKLAKDILNSYVESDEYGRKYFNRAYMGFDAIVLAVSYITAYYLCFMSDLFKIGSSLLPVSVYIFSLFYVIPLYLFLYHIFKLYTIKCVQKFLREAWNILLVNVIGLMVFSLILFLTDQIFFSRSMMAIFAIINTFLEIVIRTAVFYRFRNFK